MQIPILSGIYADGSPELRVKMPVNMVPVPISSGLSSGCLRPGDGIVQFGTGPGLDRGGINWNGQCYRVMGTKLCRIAADGTTTQLGDIPGTGDVIFDYSFDRLSIAANGGLYYWNGVTLTQVTDADLGVVIDQIWVDGYFMTTDGTYLIVTELNDPLSINPLKYGSSEADPDPIRSLVKLRNEPMALNRYTCETFDNIGGDGFPFQRIEGAQIMKGCIGPRAACLFIDVVAFVGGGRNEALGVYLGASGQAVKASTREVDLVLAEFGEEALTGLVLESVVDGGHQFLYMHLPDRTLVYDAAASKELGSPVWFELNSGNVSRQKYRARNFVYCYDKWLVGDTVSSVHGYITRDIGTHYGAQVGWQFSTSILYNESRGVVVHSMELVGLTGYSEPDAVIWSSYSVDGETWSMEKARPAGKLGERAKRIAWLQNGVFTNWRIQKFRGVSDAHVTFARLEATLEPLYV